MTLGTVLVGSRRCRHLGLDTVELKGEGFTALVERGDQVEAGQPMITYDVPAIVATGRNPIVPVIVIEKISTSVEITPVFRDSEVPADSEHRL